ncbi:PorV/PorQ family protein [bacterium]|nr:PorV/PorQ family protein [bacterium]
MSISLRMPKTLVSLIAILLLVVSANAATTFDLLRLDPTPRGAALAGNSLALLGGTLDALSMHPGGLASVHHQHVSASYSNHPLDVSGGRFSYGYPSSYGYGAFSLTYLNYGEFDRRLSLEDEVNGTFSPTDLLVSAGFAREVYDNLGVGVSVKYISSQIDDYNSSAIAMDISGHWNTGWNMVKLAVGVSNIGTQLESYIDTEEDLPTEGHFGVAKQLEHLPLVLTISGHMDIDSNFYGAAAGEFTVSPMLKLRAGYTSLGPDYHVGGSQDGLAGISAGVGVFYLDFNLDYALVSQGPVGQVHKLGITYQF